MKAGGSGDAREAPAVVEAQLGRAPRGEWSVAVTCPFGFPAVIETAPYLADGTPFPTLFYLTCPSAVHVVTREESAGGVEVFRRSVASDPGLARATAALDALQRGRRRELAAGAAPPDAGAVLERGIGGPSDPRLAACLHAYTATLLAAAAGVLTPDPRGGGSEAVALRDAWAALLGNVDRLWCRDARCAAFLPGRWQRRAAVDLGTNSVRSLVAVMDGSGDLLPLVRRARITRLGEGLAPGGSLTPEARERTADAVGAFVAEARALGVTAVTVVGTSAARDAADGAAFLAALSREIGVAARVVTGEEEAALTFLGATRDIPGDPVVVDIGGGSTELVRAAPGAAPPVDAVSLDLGCVRGTREWFTSDPPAAAERRAARQACTESFRPLAARFGGPEARGWRARDAGASEALLVGVAGTITTLACIALRVPEYDPDAIHRRVLSRIQLEAVVERLAAMDTATRAAVPCMQRGREAVIVAGGEILLGAMDGLGWAELTVSERDILDGILLGGAD